MMVLVCLIDCLFFSSCYGCVGVRHYGSDRAALLLFLHILGNQAKVRQVYRKILCYPVKFLNLTFPQLRF